MWPKLRSVAANSGLRNNNVAGGIASPELQRPKHVSSGSSSSMPSTVNVNEEYRKALRTKSYVDVCTKIHRHLRRSPCTRPSAATSPLRPRCPTSASSSGRLEEEEASSSSSSSSSSCTSPLTQLITPTGRSPLSTSSSPFFSYSHLPDDLLEPHINHEVLLSAVRDPDLHALFADYFDASAEAGNVCGSLLLSVDQLRRNHRSIQRLFNHATAVDCAGLGAYVERQNPLSALKNVHFRRIHDLYESLIRRLLRARGSIMRRARLVRLAKRASALSLVVACGALATAVLVVAAHTVVVLAVAGAPALAGPFGAWVRRRVRVNMGRPGRLTRLGEQVDAAARGAYIMSRDMETMSRMVTRLHDEVEHGKDVVRLFLRSRERWVLREVAEEAGGGAGGFTELLEELEEHVYWCLLTINRTRGLVAQEIISAGAPTTTKTTSDYIRG